MTIFEEEKGVWSMRRVLALMLCVAAVVAAVLCIVKDAPWQVVFAVVGVLLLAAIILLFFTTWSDIAKVASAVKGNLKSAGPEIPEPADGVVPPYSGGSV